MGVMDGFHSTWKKARETYGEGTPVTGEQFDQSSQLNGLASQMDAAAPGGRWSGAASEAYGKANTDHQNVIKGIAEVDKKLGVQVTNASNLVTTGRTNLDNLRGWFTDAASNLPPGQAGKTMEMQLTKTGLGQLTDIIKNTDAGMQTVKGNLDAIKGEYAALGTGQRFGLKEGPAGKDGLTDEEKKDGEKTPAEQAKEDSQAFQNGTLTDEQRQRIATNTQLNGQQKTELNNGGTTVPREQMEYVQNFSREFGDHTPAEIKAMMDKNGPTGDRATDAFQMASNSHIKTGLPETVPPSTENPSSGGKYALPDGIQKVLDGPVLTPLEYGPAEKNPDGTMRLPELIGGSQPVSGLNDLADIMQRGDPSLQKGTDLDAGVFRQGERLLEQTNGWAVPGNDLDSDRPRWYHQAVDPTLQNMFNAVNHDDVVIHDAVTGPGSEKFLDNLTKHQWQDDGLAAGGLFDWVGDTANSDSTGRAADTAHALADYTSGHSPQLLNLQGTDGQPLGQVNPELTRDLARSFSPYFDNMVGMDVGDSNGRFEPLDKDGSTLEPTNTRHLMSVLQSDHPPLGQEIDPKGPQTASQIVMDSTQQHVGKYIDIAAQSALDGKVGDNDFAMKSAGRLQAAMDLGAYDERFDVSHDKFLAQKDSHEVLSKSYDALSKGVGLVPGYGAPVSAAGDLMKDFLVGPEPTEVRVGAPQPRDMFPLQMEMAAAIAERGGGDPELLTQVRDSIDGNGHFKIPMQDGTADYGNFSTLITDYISTAGTTGAVDKMLQTYWNTYSGSMTNPSEPPK